MARQRLKTIALSVGLLTLVIVPAIAVYHLSRASDARSAMAKGQYRLAGTFYAAAADAGDADAATRLANLLYLGLGMERDLQGAARLYLEAAGQGNGAAQLNLGHLYRQGLGVRRDRQRAFAWYRIADIHGNPHAGNYLRQIAEETTLTALQMADIRERWTTLDDLMAEDL